MKPFNRLVLDPFCLRQFAPDSPSPVPIQPALFLEVANQQYQTAVLHDGYAPFCKHIFLHNFPNIPLSTLEINPENEHLLRSSYEARTEKELPVLRRYFPREQVAVLIKPAKYLDLILYSKAQVQEENKAMGSTDPSADIDYDYGIVSIKPSEVDYETPMDPITIMRNALGKDHGGSGVPLNREKYMESVAYWTHHALIK